MNKVLACIFALQCITPVYVITEQEVQTKQELSQQEKIQYMFEEVLVALDTVDVTSERYFNLCKVGIGLLGTAQNHCTSAEVLCMGQQLLCKVSSALDFVTTRELRIKLTAVKRVIIQRMQQCFVSKKIVKTQR